MITRDIHRTFPEHPQFGFAQGQQALFRVLKAYSLHDLEVGGCSFCPSLLCLSSHLTTRRLRRHVLKHLTGLSLRRWQLQCAEARSLPCACGSCSKLSDDRSGATWIVWL